MPEPLALLPRPPYHAVKETSFDLLPLPIRFWVERVASIIQSPQVQRWFRHDITAAEKARQTSRFELYLTNIMEPLDPLNPLASVSNASNGAVSFQALFVAPGDPLPTVEKGRSVSSVSMRRLPLRSDGRYYYIGQDPVTKAVHWTEIPAQGSHSDDATALSPTSSIASVATSLDFD